MSETEDQRAARLLTAREPQRLPRRFYKQAGVGGGEGRFSILLDGRPVKTPGKAALELPQRALAEAVAGEWHAQTDVIDPDRMPLTRLANTAIDRVRPRKRAVVEDILQYAGSDLVCYRADHPERLVARQQELWDPVMAWAARRFGAPFIAVTGVMPQQQSATALEGLRKSFADRDSFTLAALHNITTLTGSALIAAAVIDRHLAPEAAWAAAHLDEDWNIEQWGEDAEAAAVRARRKADFDGVAGFLALLE